ncbi:MAG: hypothetical protein MMC33_000830 [Icmadophila ericetorum]|nr:hypothetical protein [Icmadophila ericetorum]
MAEEAELHFPDAYAYQSLRSDLREVRLLHIKPADSQYELIESTLDVVRLDDVTGYTALVTSEVDMPRDHTILCERHPYTVTSNTYSSLQALCERGEQWIWWKELCVDQSNVVEDVQQKELIPLILGKAKVRRYVITLPLFEYPPLIGTDQIRLLELQPADPSKGPIIEFKFRIVSLEQNPAFTILNTTIPMPEGVMVPKNAALVSNGCGLYVAEIVFRALSGFRSSPHTTLWIDEVCINHDDPGDKSHHVILNETIHRKATRNLALRRPDFQHQSIKSADCEIRLLRIYPATSIESPLVIEIFTASLNDYPDYIALSYVWGSNQRNYGIFCSDGSMLCVTFSLFSALQEVRHQSYQVVWADQVCINQQDLQERSQQVSLMRRIYQQAKGVIIYLQPANEDQWKKFHHPDWSILVRILASTYRVTCMTRPENGRIDLDEMSKFGIPTLKHRSWRAWKAIRGHSWFTRGWIVQEIGVNADAWVLCGRRLLRWTDLVAANGLLSNEVFEIDHARQTTPHIGRYFFHNIGHLKEPEGHAPYSLFNLISAFRDVNTKDPRDKIYAFLGMAADYKLVPAPDYSHSVFQVYQEFARYFISQGDGIALLCEAGMTRCNLEIPSWVADWSFQKDAGRINFATSSALTPYPCLKSLSKIQKSMDVALTGDPLVISVKAIIVDAITGMTSGFHTFGRMRETLKSFSGFDREACDLWRGTGIAATRDGASLQEAYAKTLILGDDRFSDPLGLYEEAKAEYLYNENNDGTLADFKKSLDLDEYYRIRLVCVDGRRFGIMKKGCMGLFPLSSRVGDKVCFFQGCKTPFVLREGTTSYALVGDAYVHGLILEEYMEQEGAKFEEILLG